MSPARHQTKPAWLKVRLPGGTGFQAVRGQLTTRGLHTVCDEARCPNRGECFGRGTATFLVLGRLCTRGCRFCSVATSAAGEPPDPAEPAQVAEAVAALGLRHVVLTMVSRDDLPDGGAGHVAACVAALRAGQPGIGIELLVSDLGGRDEALATVAQAGADVLSHNLETVRRLTSLVRHPRSDYDRSLQVLRRFHELAPAEVPVKSALLVGLGETPAEVVEALEDMRCAGASLVALGQYLQPDRGCWPVAEYVSPEQFAAYARICRKLGFEGARVGPLVRSSFDAQALLLEARDALAVPPPGTGRRDRVPEPVHAAE